jgi:Heparinase II/III-like protein/Heparinase II/III N-terminus
MIRSIVRRIPSSWSHALRRLPALRRTGSTPAADELFPEPWPALPLDAAAVLNAFDPAVDDTTRIDALCLHLVSLTPRGDPIEEARRLLAEGYRPRPDAPLWPVQLPIAWDGDPFRDRNWCSQLNMLRLLDPLIRAHEAKADPQLLETALRWALDWHDFHIVRGHDHGLAWRDMMTGVRSLRLAYLADRLRLGAFTASPAQRAALADAIAEHWRRLTAPGFFRYINHTIWDLHGLTALVRVTLPAQDPRNAVWMQALGRRLDHLVDAQFDENGVHRENSPQYHFVASGMFRTLASSGWYEAVAPRLAERLPRARAQEGWMRMPDGRHIPIGDSDGEAPRSESGLPLPAADAPGDRTDWFNQSCYCLVRRTRAGQPQQWSYLAIKAGFDEAGHKHNDELSYLWSESGCDIVADPGKFAYDPGAMRDHVRSNRAHNLIAFGHTDNESRPSQRTGHLIRSLEPRPWGVEISASIRHRPSEVAHERRWFFAPGRWLVVQDRFRATKAIDFEHWTHLAPEFDVDVDHQDTSLQARHARGGSLDIGRWSSMPLSLQCCRGQSGRTPQGWVSRAYRQVEPAPAIALQGRSVEASIVLSLSLVPGGTLTAAGPGRLVWHCDGVAVELDVTPWHGDSTP